VRLWRDLKTRMRIFFNIEDWVNQEINRCRGDWGGWGLGLGKKGLGPSSDIHMQASPIHSWTTKTRLQNPFTVEVTLQARYDPKACIDKQTSHGGPQTSG